MLNTCSTSGLLGGIAIVLTCMISVILYEVRELILLALVSNSLQILFYNTELSSGIYVEYKFNEVAYTLKMLKICLICMMC